MQEPIRWDMEKVALCLQTGKHRQDVIQILHDLLEERQPEFDSVEAQAYPDDHNELFVQTIREAAVKILASDGRKQAYTQDLHYVALECEKRKASRN